MSTRFAAGHRVIVTNSHPPLIGYYGHVLAVARTDTTRPMVLVSLQGRASGEVDPKNLDPDGDDPYVLYDDELEHAD